MKMNKTRELISHIQDYAQYVDNDRVASAIENKLEELLEHLEEDVVLVSMDEHESNERDLYFLQCLEYHGVENWVGYDLAHDDLKKRIR